MHTLRSYYCIIYLVMYLVIICQQNKLTIAFNRIG